MESDEILGSIVIDGASAEDKGFVCLNCKGAFRY
jgi:hypothetical protein